MKDIFDIYIENSFNADYSQSTAKKEQFIFNYKKYFRDDKNLKVLDIGIGRGEMLSCYKEWGYIDYLGIDISPSTINYCKTLDLKCELVNDTQRWLKQNINCFDVITLIDVLEHIKKVDTLDFLKDIKNSLKKNGILIIQVPNLQSPDGQLHRYNDFTHEFGYIEHSLAQVLITVGFNKFHFGGFETIIGNKIKTKVKRLLRLLYWNYVKFIRKITDNINPQILHPVFYSIINND